MGETIADRLDVDDTDQANETPDQDSQNDQEAEERQSLTDVLLADTADGPVDDRLDHPLNPMRSQGMARMIRGLEGMVGSLRKALVDILVGGVHTFWEWKTGGFTSSGSDGSDGLPTEQVGDAAADAAGEG